MIASAGRRAWALACAVAAVGLLWTALPLVEHSLHTRPGDGVVDWLGARAWLDHVNVFSPEGLKAYGLEPYGFAHPPTAPFWLLPFTVFDVDMLGTMMGYTTLLLVVFHLVTTANALALPAPSPFAALALGLLFHASWFHTDLIMAQVSEPIAFVYLLAWIALRSGRDLSAGIAIGLACTFKPFAGVLWLMLLSLRRWRAATLAIAAWLGVAWLMTSRFGLVSWLQWNAFNKQTALVWLGDIRNTTLPGLVLRAVHPVCMGGRNPPQLGASLVAVMLGGAILFGCHRLARSAASARPADPSRLDLVFAAWSVASVFVNPVAWEHYAFILLTPIAIVLSCARSPVYSAWRRMSALGLGLLAAFLLSFDANDRMLASHRYLATHQGHLRLHLLEVASALPWALTLAAACLLLWWRDRAAQVSPRPSE